MSEVVDFFSRSTLKKSEGVAIASTVTLADELRELAAKLDRGEIPPLRQMVCIPVEIDRTGTPYILGDDSTVVELIGRLEICKATVIDMLWVDDE